jgi:hypothetical protein
VGSQPGAIVVTLQPQVPVAVAVAVAPPPGVVPPYSPPWLGAAEMLPQPQIPPPFPPLLPDPQPHPGDAVMSGFCGRMSTSR